LCSITPLLLLAFVPSVSAASYSFTDVNVSFPGATGTTVYKINNSGQMVGQWTDQFHARHGFLLSGGTYTSIDCPSPYTQSTAAFGINNLGNIVGWCARPGGINGFYGVSVGFLLSGGVFTFLTDPGSYGGASVQAYDINDSGQIVGLYTDPCLCRQHGFLFSGGIYTTLDAGLGSTIALGINNTGKVVGNTQVNFGGGDDHSFLLDGGVYTIFDPPGTSPGTDGSEAVDINDSGQIVGDYVDSSHVEHAYLLDGGIFTTIDHPSASGTGATGINAQGQIAGNWFDFASVIHGFVATGTGADTTAPVLSNIPLPITMEGNTLGGATVTFPLPTATDPDDAAGAVTCAPASGSVFALGQTMVTCSSTDTHNNTGSATFMVTVVDTTPPVLTLPQNITIDATSPAGAAVTFAAYANDTVSGIVAVACLPASGATFPIGTTTVNCSAQDGSGNTATGAFTITVLSGAQITSDLLGNVVIDGFQQSQNLLQNVMKSLSKGNTSAACSQLNSFLSQVQAQTGKSLTASEAASLTSAANAAKAAIGCP
jgi:uncharacterized membrane protein